MVGVIPCVSWWWSEYSYNFNWKPYLNFYRRTMYCPERCRIKLWYQWAQNPIYWGSRKHLHVCQSVCSATHSQTLILSFASTRQLTETQELDKTARRCNHIQVCLPLQAWITGVASSRTCMISLPENLWAWSSISSVICYSKCITI